MPGRFERKGLEHLRKTIPGPGPSGGERALGEPYTPLPFRNWMSAPRSSPVQPGVAAGGLQVYPEAVRL